MKNLLSVALAAVLALSTRGVEPARQDEGIVAIVSVAGRWERSHPHPEDALSRSSDVLSYWRDLTFAESAVRPILARGTVTSEILTGKWPGTGISPNSALAALISDTVAFEKVQM